MIEGCGEEFSLEGEDFICGDEIETNNTKSGCGYLLCSKCRAKHDTFVSKEVIEDENK